MADFKFTGLITTAELKSCSEVEPRDPILVISEQVALHRGDSISLVDMSKFEHEFTVPIDYLETPTQCERWIGQRLKSLGLNRVVAETGDSKVLLRELIWKMKKRREAGEVYTAVVEVAINFGAVETQAEIFRPTMVAWVNDMRSKFSGAEGSCCSVCLDGIVEEADVVELECRHVFHSRCIEAWLSRMINCPYCRSPINIRSNFWELDALHLY